MKPNNELDDSLRGSLLNSLWRRQKLKTHPAIGGSSFFANEIFSVKRLSLHIIAHKTIHAANAVRIQSNLWIPYLK
jgi:hypothetical protein